MRLGLFHLGRLLITPGALDTFTHNELRDALVRHANGDWGEMCAEDKYLNDTALARGGRLFSAYKFPPQSGEKEERKLWIITYPGEYTTILLPEEY